MEQITSPHSRYHYSNGMEENETQHSKYHYSNGLEETFSRTNNQNKKPGKKVIAIETPKKESK
jgi:hypothetical protein